MEIIEQQGKENMKREKVFVQRSHGEPKLIAT